jgi:hypothetical protein
MKNTNDSKNVQFYSQPKGDFVFVNHAGKIYLFFVLIMFLIPITAGKDIDFIKRLSYIILIMTIILFLIGKIVRHFINQIVIDFRSSQIKLSLYRNDNTITLNFNELKYRQTNRRIIFFVSGKKLYYNGPIHDSLVKSLKKIKGPIGTAINI